MRDGEEEAECEDEREVATCVWERGAAQRRRFLANRHGLNKVPRESGLKARVGTVMAAQINSILWRQKREKMRPGEGRKVERCQAV